MNSQPKNQLRFCNWCTGQEPDQLERVHLYYTDNASGQGSHVGQEAEQLLFFRTLRIFVLCPSVAYSAVSLPLLKVAEGLPCHLTITQSSHGGLGQSMK